jgi:HEPN domain-containing protein
MNSAFKGFDSGRLWSLLDMLEINAKSFVTAIEQLASASAIVAQITRNSVNPEIGAEKIDGENAEKTLNHLKEISKCCEVLGVNTTLALGIRMCESLEKRELTYVQIGQQIKELVSRFKDELGATKLYSIPKDIGAFYTSADVSFGTEVVAKFLSASDDLEEASKCLALSRSTACVFHLMRATEIAVAALYSKLNVTGNSDREWGKLLSDIGNAIEAMPKSDLRNKWSANHSLLYHVKQAWRNEVMHPKQSYTIEQAREVLESVKSFMRNLSELV